MRCRHGRARAALIALLATALPGAAFAGTAAAEVPNSPDVFNQQTFNPISGGNEVGFTTAQTLSRGYDSSLYTFDPGHGTEERARSGCALGGSTFSFGSRTAWMRFVPAVKGRLGASASTPYDVVLFAYRTSQARGAPFDSNSLVSIDCIDASKGGGETNVVVPSSAVVPGQAILLETASYCGASAATCNASAPGGATTLSVKFTPDDGDADGVPDTLDQCPTTKGVAPGGCPPPSGDGDHDGVLDSSDACPFEYGTNADGCPDPDKDGVKNTDDKCPTTFGPAADGCPDSDGDKVSDRIDKCPHTFGDGARGCPTPLASTIKTDWLVLGSTTVVRKLKLTAPKRTRVEVRCRGKSCKSKRKTFVLRKSRTRSLLRYLPGDHRLRAGTVLTVRTTRRGSLGRYVRFTMRTGALPKVRTRCISTSGKLRRCGG